METLMERKNHMESLVEEASKGDRQAFDRLTRENYERSRSLVLHFLGGIPGGVSVDDVLQETFLRAYLQIKRFTWEGEDSFFRWLGGIARNVIRELNKKRKRAPQ